VQGDLSGGLYPEGGVCPTFMALYVSEHNNIADGHKGVRNVRVAHARPLANLCEL